MSAQWTPETWCSCPRCNGPSLPTDREVEGVTEELVCHACDHEWTGTPAQLATAKRMDKDLEAPGDQSHIVAPMPWVWREKLAEDKAKLERAMRGEW